MKISTINHHFRIRPVVVTVAAAGHRHGFAAINVQLDTGRKRFLGWSIDVARDRHLARRRGKACESIVCESVV